MRLTIERSIDPFRWRPTVYRRLPEHAYVHQWMMIWLGLVVGWKYKPRE